jgi:hypothetical protein
MSETYHCWKCSAALADLPLPLARLAECKSCRAELHACRMCAFFDPAAADQCREPMAERVVDKQRANFCEWFRISLRAGTAAPAQGGDEARRQLESLFGISAGDGGERSPEDAARKRLEDLFPK